MSYHVGIRSPTKKDREQLYEQRTVDGHVRFDPRVRLVQTEQPVDARYLSHRLAKSWIQRAR